MALAAILFICSRFSVSCVYIFDLLYQGLYGYGAWRHHGVMAGVGKTSAWDLSWGTLIVGSESCIDY